MTRAGVGRLLVVIGLLLIVSGLFWWYFVGETWGFSSEYAFGKSIGAIVLVGVACLSGLTLIGPRNQEPPNNKPDP